MQPYWAFENIDSLIVRVTKLYSFWIVCFANFSYIFCEFSRFVKLVWDPLLISCKICIVSILNLAESKFFLITQKCITGHLDFTTVKLTPLLFFLICFKKNWTNCSKIAYFSSFVELRIIACTNRWFRLLVCHLGAPKMYGLKSRLFFLTIWHLTNL